MLLLSDTKLHVASETLETAVRTSLKLVIYSLYVLIGFFVFFCNCDVHFYHTRRLFLGKR